MPESRSFPAKSWHCCPLPYSQPKTTLSPLCVWRKCWEGFSACNIQYCWSCAPFSTPHVHYFNGLHFKVTFFCGACTWRNWEIQAHKHGFWFWSYVFSHTNGLKSCEVHLCSNFTFMQLICLTDGCRFKCPCCSLLAEAAKLLHISNHARDKEVHHITKPR